MKKLIKLFILIIISLSVYFIYNLKDTSTIIYTSLGDGFADGINSYGDKNYGYSNYVSDNIKKEESLNRSYLNFTSKDMTINDLRSLILLNNHDNNQNNIRQVLRETDLLTISVGINDLIYKMNVENITTNHQKEKTITEIVDNLDITLQEITKYYQKNIYLIGYYNFYPQNSVERKMLESLNSKLEEYSMKNNLIFVDNSNMDKSLSLYLDNPNSIYPNIDGYKKISDNIWSKMLKNEKVLEK